MKPERHGITLVETVVVIAIIGVLLAILIPAVQSFRERARRVTCENNLRQIALAIQNHESAHGSLPSLYHGTFLKRPQIIRDEFRFHSWRTAILPQLEQGSLYQRIDLARPARDAANQDNLITSIPVFLCPSTSTPNSVVPEILVYNGGATPTDSIGPAARSDYEAVAGVRFPRTTPFVDNSLIGGVRWGVWGEPEYGPNTGGEILRCRVARLRDVSDGLSNTMIVGERAGRPDFHRHGGIVDPYPYSDPSSAGVLDQAAWGISTHVGRLMRHFELPVNHWNSEGLYSFHSMGANVALADGSVRFLSEQTDTSILNALATRAAGDVVTLD